MTDAPRRGFHPIEVELAGVQLGSSRFAGDPTSPRVARQRNNLTGLSQYRNLYVVAYRDRIYLYEPRFPSQSLGDRPVLAFRLPVSAPGLKGDLSRRNPHAVNRLLLDDLGDEETLACVCDDGDVLLYHMTSIVGAMQQRGAETLSAENKRPPLFPRPFFHENVGRSAWGIAMHKTRRMLAVSNNHHVIDVIAFALRERGEGSSGEEESELERAITHNTHVRLRGHVHNIPSVAFCSNSWDVEGRWLVSIDITGLMIIWNIWDSSQVVRKRFNESGSGLGVWGGHGMDRYGWGVLCLDRTAAKLVDNFRQKYGFHPPPPRPTEPIDISATRYDVDDFSVRFPGGSGGAGGGAAATTDDPSSSPDDGDDPPAPSPLGFLPMGFLPAPVAVPWDPPTPPNPHADHSHDDDDHFNAAVNAAVQEHLASTGVAEPMDTYEDLILTAEDMASMTQMNDVNDQEDDDEDDTDYDDDEEGDEVEEEDALEFDSMVEDDPDDPDETQSPAGSDTAAEDNVPAPDGGPAKNTAIPMDEEPTPARASSPLLPRFAVLCTSDDTVRLLMANREPSVICHRPLAQQLSHATSRLVRNERLNMVMEVPELSLVVVGSQAGRVALFRLTRDPSEPGVGLRLEHILPTLSQETEGHRPARPLLGFAIGPIQGRERLLGPDHVDVPTTTPRRRQQLWRRVEPTRRYRLMLTYSDHTVLAYEIGRTHPSTVASSIGVDTHMTASSSARPSGGHGVEDDNDFWSI
ncbi:MAG: GTPase activating protein [Watsoniomyces obsoletus]|nr:MAG: GTPase activating protein [Watsoniomyces obsoletus]